MKIRITADSTCDLSPALCEAYGVTLAPLSVLVDSDAYHDGVNITPPDIFAAVEAGKNVHSGAVNVAEYEELFREQLKSCDAVIHFALGHRFSACYTNACVAATLVENVYVVDTMNLSTGCAHLVLDAVDMANQGMDPQTIVDAVKASVPLIDTSFVVNTIDYLYRGGRCSGVEALGAKLLSIRPGIEVVDGKMKPGKKYRGSVKRVMEHYVEDRLANREDLDTSRVFVNHCYCDQEIIDAMTAKVRAMLPEATILETVAGSTIAVHCGPGTLSLGLKRKTPKEA